MELHQQWAGYADSSAALSCGHGLLWPPKKVMEFDVASDKNIKSDAPQGMDNYMHFV